jgi:uncharacterized membrane-anchored protein
MNSDKKHFILNTVIPLVLFTGILIWMIFFKE